VNPAGLAGPRFEAVEHATREGPLKQGPDRGAWSEGPDAVRLHASRRPGADVLRITRPAGYDVGAPAHARSRLLKAAGGTLVWGGPVQVPVLRRCVDGVTGLHDDDVAAARLDETDPFGDVKSLAQHVLVLCGPGARGEVPGVDTAPRGLFTLPEETVAAVEAALGAGYLHVDTAAAYFDEREVGEGIRRPTSTAPRSSSRRRPGSAITAAARRCMPST
jgi:hypothetical protein